MWHWELTGIDLQMGQRQVEDDHPHQSQSPAQLKCSDEDAMRRPADAAGQLLRTATAIAPAIH